MTMAAILISVLTVGVVSVLSIRRESDRSSVQEMRLLCENCRSGIDESLNSIEQSVDVIARYALEEMSSVALLDGGVIGVDGRGSAVLDRSAEQRTDLDLYLHEHSEKLETLCLSVAERTNGVVSFYYRINPELSLREKGFFYTKTDSASFVSEKPTAIGYYAPDDIEHVGWYYIPMERGRPSWLQPYYNANLGVRMISYVAPLYKAGTFLGVIGMDIDEQTLIDRVRDVRIFKTGFAILMAEDGTVVYHPFVEAGQHIPWKGTPLETAMKQMIAESNEAKPMRYEFQGDARQMFFTGVRCGLELILTAPVREINESGQRLINRIVCLLAVIIVVFFAIVTALVRHVTDPLKRLTEAAKHLAGGNYDVRMDYHRNDEVGTLTKAFEQLVSHLQVYISDLNSKAYQDAMTGVRNKGAYEMSARKLDDAIRLAKADGEEPAFAMVMFDCNNLKAINDTYGHDKGDVYLRTACRLICDVFRHSPVFRLGGDEFAAILTEESYERREVLFRTFGEEAARVSEAAPEPWEVVCVAKGMAAYDPALDDSAESVLRRADEAMYADKKRSKAARGQTEPPRGESA